MTISRTVDGRFQSLPFSTCDPLGGRSFLGLAGGFAELSQRSAGDLLSLVG